MKKEKENELLKKFGAYIKHLREQKGLSLRQLAENCGIDNSRMSKIERGTINVRISTMLELANCLGIAPMKLFDYHEKGEEVG